MAGLTLKAHYDGRSILLDEPYDLQAKDRLLVTVLSPEEVEGAEWALLAAEGLAKSYGDDEPEYSEADLQP